MAKIVNLLKINRLNSDDYFKSYFDFLAAIKLLTKRIKAYSVDISIILTRTMAILSARPNVAKNGLKSPIKTKIVNTTAICACILFSCLIPFMKMSSVVPIITGINAVGEGVVDEIYPHNPIVIKSTAFIKLAK